MPLSARQIESVIAARRMVERVADQRRRLSPFRPLRAEARAILRHHPGEAVLRYALTVKLPTEEGAEEHF